MQFSLLMHGPNLWRFWYELVSSLQTDFFFHHLRLFVAQSSSTKVDSHTCTKNIEPYGLLGGPFLKSKPYCFQLTFAFRFGFIWKKDQNVKFRQSTFERTAPSVRIVAQKQRKNCTRGRNAFFCMKICLQKKNNKLQISNMQNMIQIVFDKLYYYTYINIDIKLCY